MKTKLFLFMLVSILVIFMIKDMTKNSYNETTNLYIAENVDTVIEEEIEYDLKKNNTNSNFICDGREYCSQMNSCEEATYFINNCPNTKMDGNHDGVPCERQWCQR